MKDEKKIGDGAKKIEEKTTLNFLLEYLETELHKFTINIDLI